MKKMIQRIAVLVICIILVSGFNTRVYAATANNSYGTTIPDVVSIEPIRYNAPFAYISSVTLVQAQTYNNGYTTYNIILGYSANDSVSSIRISSSL